MRTTLAALICCLLVATLAGATAVAGAPSTTDPGPDDTVAPTSSSIESEHDGPPASTRSAALADAPLQSDDDQSRPETIEIEIGADGDAHFVLSKEFPAESDAERRAFDRLADEYERGEHGNLGFSAFEASFGNVAAESAREMELIDDGRHVVREDGVGRLEYRFTWTNFAERENGSVAIGDAFVTDGDVWLNLQDGQRLIVRAPDGYGVAEGTPEEIDDDALIWTGPTTFDSGDLRVTFDQSADGSALPMRVLLALVASLVLGMVFVAGWWVLRDRDEWSVDDVRASVGTILDDAAPASSTPDEDPGPTDRPDEGGTTAVTDAEPSAAAGSSEPVTESEDAVDPELLSDEERVENLLEQNGGRMKQATIVTETGWSNAKVSQLLSSMDEEDRIDKLRIGRENLITLPDVDVTDQE